MRLARFRIYFNIQVVATGQFVQFILYTVQNAFQIFIVNCILIFKPNQFVIRYDNYNGIYNL